MAESARLQRRRNSGEELPKSEVRGGGREELPHTPTPESRGSRWEELPTPHRRPGAAAGSSNPTPKARGRGREDQPHVQEAVATGAQEGLEELSHIEGQEGQL